MSFKSNLMSLLELSHYWISCNDDERYGLGSTASVGLNKVVELYTSNNQPDGKISTGTVKTLFDSMIKVGNEVIAQLSRFINVDNNDDDDDAEELLSSSLEEFIPQFDDDTLRSHEKCLPKHFNVTKKQMDSNMLSDKREDYILLLNNCVFMAKTIQKGSHKNVASSSSTSGGRTLSLPEEEAEYDIEHIITGGNNKKKKKRKSDKKESRTYSSASSNEYDSENSEDDDRLKKKAKSSNANVVTGSGKKNKKRLKVENVVKPSEYSASTLIMKSLLAEAESDKKDKIENRNYIDNQDLFTKLSDIKYFTSTDSYQTMKNYLDELGIYHANDVPTLKKLTTTIPENILKTTMKQSLKTQFEAYLLN